MSRHLLILPRDNRITTLIIDAIHQQLMHAGADHVLNELRQTFWFFALGKPSRKW